MRRFDKKGKIRKANILLEERMRTLKEYGSEFGPGGEFDDSELQGQEDFYDQMNQNSKVEEDFSNIDYNDSQFQGENGKVLSNITYFVKSLPPNTPKIFKRIGDLGGELDDVLQTIAQGGDSSIRSHEDFLNMMELIDNNTDFFFKELSKKFKGIENYMRESKDYNILKQLKESFDKTYNKIKRVDEDYDDSLGENDNMNRNSKEETSDVNEERPITARYGDDPTPEEKEFIANFVKTSGDKEETSDVNEDEFTDDILNKSNPKEPIVRKDLVGKPNKAVPSLSVEYAIEFVPSGTFSAVHAAESYLSDMDYTAGSMERDAPIGFSNKYNRISKWWNMTRDEHKLLDGVMISDDFREGGVTILFFTPPNF